MFCFGPGEKTGSSFAKRRKLLESRNNPQTWHEKEKHQGWRHILPDRWLDILDIGTSCIRWYLEEISSSIPQGALLLDAGAGECQYRSLFSHTRYIGVDYAVGDPHWNYSRLDVVADIAQLPFKENSFEVVLCTQVLEHVCEPERVLRELYRVLKPGGKLILTAPGTSEEHQIPYDYYRFTSYGLQYLFEKVGFQVQEIRRLGGHFWFLIIVVPRMNTFLWGPKSKILLLPFYLLSKLLLGVLLPLLFFYLDRFDREKKLALNFAILALKPS